MKRTVLFDGECNFCDASVQFIIKRDPYEYFQFASLQSETGQQLSKDFGVPEYVDSLVLIEKGKAYTKSGAALRIAKKLDGLWHLTFLFIIVPSPIRNSVYDFFARNRYKWFGKKEEACMLPTTSERKRFL
ncbi:thiol-disulfide oxidoreductase DCC family protein [Sporosarcina sp. BI001-red]|uniref:thiol-disulfide oxidoreductase DCC family protein n=1 Tax=Sporosarcina sp. BI001-red TaxID=2282866 RepID=UPI000E26792A|nr:thiol-disulfide oxidoreductase DCC family protein [Sporosarcina sp. BI001-red]REB07959.1 thiol-disulfide oxidoreductase DCC family protein [Sporosarcina sp. BI001-red]